MVYSISSKKRTKTRRIVIKMNLYVRFLEEFKAWQFAFEINWPLKSEKNVCNRQNIMLGSSFSQRFQTSGILSFHVLIISKTETGMEKRCSLLANKLPYSREQLNVWPFWIFFSKRQAVPLTKTCYCSQLYGVIKTRWSNSIVHLDGG